MGKGSRYVEAMGAVADVCNFIDVPKLLSDQTIAPIISDKLPSRCTCTSYCTLSTEKCIPRKLTSISDQNSTNQQSLLAVWESMQKRRTK